MPTCANMCHSVSTWANIAVCQLCRERQPFWNSHDGLNLTCLDQCHGVVSHGTSYSQGWRQRLVIQQSELDPFSSHLSFRRRWLLQVCLGKPPMEIGKSRHWTSVFFCREFHRATKAIAQMNADWEGPVCWVQCANMWQDCSLTAVQRKTVFLEQSWWSEFDMFGSMPWCSLAAAKELLYSLQSKFDRWVYIYILVFAEGDCCRFAQGKLSPCLCGHQCFSVVAHQDSPRLAQGLFWNERSW